MNRYAVFSSDPTGVEQAVEYCHTFFRDAKISRREQTKAALVMEEAIESLVAHRTGEESMLNVHARARFGTITIELSAPGEEYALAHNMNSAALLEEDISSTDTLDTIRNILLRSLTDGLKYRHKNDVNYIRMTVVRSRHAFLYQTLGAMLAAIAVGALLSLMAPGAFNSVLDANILSPVKTMYMNALKMVVAPVVFFSIISCIVQFSDLSALGRIGIKIFAMYILTTVIAVAVGFGAFFLLEPGNAALTEGVMADATSITSQNMDVSIKDTIVDIVPSNFVAPFVNSNMMQLIFLAILFGIATGLIGKYSTMLTEFFQALNDLFLKVATIIIKVMPIAVFCSIASMMLSMGISSILSVLGMFGTFLFGLACMILVYCLLMLVFARLNPIPFLKKYSTVMLQVFSTGSSNASIPLNMDACENKLGISEKVFSLSIPLGATLNMDGTCIYLAVFSLALAKAYGITVTGGMLLSMMSSIIVLSMGAPGIPNSGLICLSVLLAQMNVPVEAIGLIMGIDSFAGMFRTMNNCLGDVAVTSIVAKSEGEMDLNVYMS